MFRVDNATARPLKASRRRSVEVAGLIIAFAAAVAIAAIFSSLAPQASDSAAMSGDRSAVTDGWLPGALARRLGLLDGLADGYLPGLVHAKAAKTDPRDGWEGSLLH